MSLRSKVFLILFLIVIMFASLNYVILNHVVFPGFVALEQDEAKKDITRTMEAIQREVHHLDSLCHDWAAWNDTYDFIKSGNEEYIENNLVLTSFTDNELNLIYFLDNQGNVIWGEIRDLETEKLIRLPEFSSNALPINHPLLSYQTSQIDLKNVSGKGVYLTSLGPLLVSARPILTSDNEGPIRGTLIMGRFLSDEVIETLVEQTRVTFRFWAPKTESIPTKDRNAFGKITPDNPIQIEERSSELLHAYAIYPDLKGAPALLIRGDIARPITAKGAAITRYALISILIAGLFVLAILIIMLQTMVLGPVFRLTRHVIAIGKKNDLTKRFKTKARDEIGILGDEFNQMTEKLVDARNRLLEQSYYSGKAEMASGILHNVRNTLSPIVGQIGIICEKIDETPIDNIKRAVGELEGGAIDDERKESLNRYLQLGSSNMVSFVRDTSDQLKSILQDATQIEAFLANQDKFSHADRALEPLHLEKIVQEAADMMPQHLHDAVSVEIDPDMSQLPATMAERVVIIQVISSLLNNAAKSILRTDMAKGQIRIDANVENDKGNELIHTRIQDNGEGIDAENLKPIFNRSVSKKDSSRSGIGLHWCGNAMTAMNGRLYAKSDGIGQGACFHLMIPVVSQ